MTSFDFKGPTDKQDGAWHQSYPIFYRRILASLKDTKNSACEVGTDSGYPLLAYRDWFQNAQMIVGVDINSAPQCLWGREGVHHYQMDAYTPECIGFLKSHGEFACLVDDGSHLLGHQEFFARNYPALLAEDGIAIIEDIQDANHLRHLQEATPMGFIAYGVDLRHADSRYDSLLLVIERRIR